MAQVNPKSDQRKYYEVIYELFHRFALDDQRRYYANTVRRARKAADQVNRLRATFALLTGLASALAGLIATIVLVPANCSAVAEGVTRPAECGTAEAVVALLTIVSVVAPALGAAFTTLADLYQWDRIIPTYQTALENLEVADANSPLDEMDDMAYRAALRAYAEGALHVMESETAQWGQIAQQPPQLEKFLEEERQKVARFGGTPGTPVDRRTESEREGGNR